MNSFYLKDLIEIYSGFSTFNKDFILNNKGDYPVISSSAKNDGIIGNINTYKFERAITINRTASSLENLGKVIFRDYKFSPNLHVYTIICDESKIDIKFLYYFLLNNIQKIQKLAEGTIIKTISKRIIKNLKIDLPSLKEQKEIVSKIEGSSFLQNFSLENNFENNNSVFINQLLKTKEKLLTINFKLEIFMNKIINLLFENKLKTQSTKFKNFIENISYGLMGEILNQTEGDTPILTNSNFLDDIKKINTFFKFNSLTKKYTINQGDLLISRIKYSDLNIFDKKLKEILFYHSLIKIELDHKLNLEEKYYLFFSTQTNNAKKQLKNFYNANSLIETIKPQLLEKLIIKTHKKEEWLKIGLILKIIFHIKQKNQTFLSLIDKFINLTKNKNKEVH